MDHERRVPPAVVGWSILALGAGCVVAAVNWWSTWRSHSASAPPESAIVVQARDRMEFWLGWAALAVLGAAVVWGLRRWAQPRRDDVGPSDHQPSRAPGDPARATPPPGAHGAAATSVDQRAQDPPTPRLDWRTPTAPRPLHWVDVARWALGLGWVALVAAVLLAGARAAPYEELVQGVSSGSVTRVTVGGAQRLSSESVTQDVTWRQGWVHHRAEVLWVRAGATISAPSDGSSVPVVRQDVAQVLTATAPAGLAVERADRVGLSSVQFLGWYLPAPQVTAPVLLAGALLALFLVLNVPPTWWLTRWAWFWIGFTPVGVLLLALFAGPTPGLPVPRRPQQRIGGLVAFVVSLLAAPLLHWGSR